MPEKLKHTVTIEEVLQNASKLKHSSSELSTFISDLHKNSAEIVNRRRAALNVLEDAFMSKQALRKSEERLDLALKAAKMGTFIYYVQQDRAEPDEQMLALFGLDEGEPLSLQRALAELIHPDDRQRYADDVARAVNEWSNGRLNSDIRVIHPDGSVHWLNVTAQVNFEGAERRATIMSGVCMDITERKNAEEALRESEERLRLATGAANIYSWEYIVATNTYSFSQNAAEILGVAQLPATPEESWQLAHPGDRNLIEKTLQQALNTAKGFTIDFRSLKDDGSIVWLSVQTTMITDVSGKPSRLLGIAQDISNRKKAEQALRESENAFRSFVLASSDIVYKMSPDWQVMYVLEGKDLLVSANNVNSWINLYIPEEERKKVQEAIDIAITTKTMFELEHLVVNAQGGLSWVYSRAVPHMNSLGELIEWIGAARNITERKLAEEQLRVFEERNRIALQSAEMASWDWNIKEDRIIWNEQHYHVVGVQPDNKERQSEDFLQFVHPDDLEQIKQALKEATEVTGMYKAEFRIIRADKEIRWMNGFGRAVEWDAAKAIRMIGVMFDITDRKKLEQQKEDFISIASHELKTPVTSIKAYAEVLHDIVSESGDETGSILLKKLDEQVDRLIDLIRALLDTSKLAEGELSLHTEKFELCDLIKERITDLQRLSSSHHIKFITSKEILVTADKERIGQVLNNFISNAIKYSPDGGDVIIRCEQTENTVQVSVKDNGIGISEEMQQKVFDRFFRVKSEQMKNYAGLGLGLYITAYIIQKHGGKIWVESKEDEGSTFYFTLPVKNV